jgi:hypothetical protein
VEEDCILSFVSTMKGQRENVRNTTHSGLKDVAERTRKAGIALSWHLCLFEHDAASLHLDLNPIHHFFCDVGLRLGRISVVLLVLCTVCSF